MFTTKHFLLAAAVALTLGSGTAFAGEGDDGSPFPMRGQPQVFAFSIPAVDVGSEAYPSTAGMGAAEASKGANHVTRDGVRAYQRGFDVGSAAYPTPQ